MQLSTATQNTIENVVFGGPYGLHFGGLFRKSVVTVQGHTAKCPQDTKMDPKASQMYFKGDEMTPQGLPKAPKRLPTIPMCV